MNIALQIPSRQERSATADTPELILNTAEEESNYYAQVRKIFAEFLEPLTRGVRELNSSTLIALDYSSIIPDGTSENGESMFESARLYDPSYSIIVRAEDHLVVRDCCPDFSKMLGSLKLPFDSLGPGTIDAVMKKDIPILRVLDSDSYTYNAIEMDEEIARTAVITVQSQLKRYGRSINARPNEVDFTQKWPKKLRYGSARFSAMLGGTMGQFDMHEFFGHYYKMTDGKGLLFFTLNCNRENPKQDYSGPMFEKFKGYTWSLLKQVSGDSSFDTTSPRYIPDFVGGKIRHLYFFQRDTSVRIDGKDYLIPQGTTAITGYSARPDPNSVAAKAKGTGMELVKTYRDTATHSYGFLLKGNNFPHPMIT